MLDKNKPLHDLSPMPWGEYKGMPMQDVPAKYLHWLWTNPRDQMRLNTKHNPVAVYIWQNISHMRKEHPDGIWDNPPAQKPPSNPLGLQGTQLRRYKEELNEQARTSPDKTKRRVPGSSKGR